MAISDAFRDTELVAGALDDAFAGRRSFKERISDYRQARDDEVPPVFAPRTSDESWRRPELAADRGARRWARLRAPNPPVRSSASAERNRGRAPASSRSYPALASGLFSIDD